MKNSVKELKAGRIRALSSYGDAAAGNSEDEFGVGRDNIAVHPSAPRRTGHELDISDEEDEVYALDLPRKAHEDDTPAVSAPSKKRKSQSDQHVAIASVTRTSRNDRPDESDSASSSSEQAEADESEDDTNWRGAYHVSTRDRARKHSKTDAQLDEENAILELNEARRIQAEHRNQLDPHDYGIDAPDDDLPDAEEEEETVEEMDEPTAISHLLKTSPELLSLLTDFAHQSARLPVSEAYVQSLSTTAEKPKLAFAWLFHEALSSYLQVAAFYLHLRAKPRNQVKQSLLSTVLERLVTLRDSISILEDQDLVDLPGEEKEHPVLGEYGGDSMDEDEREEMHTFMANLGDLDDDELDALIEERRAALGETIPQVTDLPTKKKRKADKDTSDKPKRRKKSKPEIEQPLQITDILSLSSKPSTTLPTTTHSDFLEPTSLTTTEATEKAASKRSLRFYTTKIDTSAKRRAAGAEARAGGDVDLPYRSKEAARAAVLQRQNRLTEQQKKAAELDDLEWDDGDLGDAAGGEYYDLVAGEARQKKDRKKEEYDAQVALSRADPMARTFDPTAPRAITRAISANKGLTPKRPKSVRNPRVKKRMKYESAKKKVASMKAVYKGPEDKAGYGGEKSGIAHKVVKSRKL